MDGTTSAALGAGAAVDGVAVGRLGREVKNWGGS